MGYQESCSSLAQRRLLCPREKGTVKGFERHRSPPSRALQGINFGLMGSGGLQGSMGSMGSGPLGCQSLVEEALDFTRLALQPEIFLGVGAVLRGLCYLSELFMTAGGFKVQGFTVLWLQGAQPSSSLLTGFRHACKGYDLELRVQARILHAVCGDDSTRQP